MIALAKGLPFLQIGEADLVPVERVWLTNQLRQAAKMAHMEDWEAAPLADNVAHGLLTWLHHRSPASTISMPAVEARVRQSLCSLGYTSMAEAVHLRPPNVTVSLLSLAKEAGNLPLLFFPLLQKRLLRLARAKVPLALCQRAKEASLALAGTKTWSNRAHANQTEIAQLCQEFTPLFENGIQLTNQAAPAEEL